MSQTGPQGDAERGSAASRVTVLVAFAVVALVALVAIHVVDYIPTHDGPQHLYASHIFNHFGDSATPYDQYYVPGQPLSVLGFTLLFSPLEALLGWRGAVQAVFTLVVIGWAVGMGAIARRLHPARLPAAALAFVIAFQWALYMGFFSYVLSTVLGLATIAVALGGGEPTWPWRRRAVIFVLLSSQGLLHVFGAQVTAVVLVALVVARTPPKRWLREGVLLALMGLPVILLVGYAAARLLWGADTEPRSEATHPDLGERIALLRGAFLGGPWWRAWPPLLMMLASMALAVARWRSLRPEERGLLVAGGVLLVLFSVSPLDMAGWQFFSPRFLPMAAACLLPLLPWEKLNSARHTAATCAQSVFVVAALVWTIWFHLDLRSRMADVDEGLRATVATKGPRLPIVLDPSAGLPLDWREASYAFYEPALNIGALYAVEQGGVIPYTFTVNAQLHVFVFSEEGLDRFPRAPERLTMGRAWLDALGRGAMPEATAMLTRFAWYGAAYDDVILLSRFGSERALFVDRGYEVVHEHGRLSILRFRGCPVRMAVASPIGGPFVIRTGWAPVDDLVLQAVVPPGAGEAGRVASDPLKTPCGPAWFEAFVDEDGSSSLTPGDRVCVWGGKSERVTVTLTPESKVVPCSHLRPW
jgi:hypothetical protein